MIAVKLDIDESYFTKFVNLLKALPDGAVKGNYTYIDELGDTIEVRNGVEYVVASKEDKKAAKQAAKEFQEGKTLSLMDLKGKFEFRD